MRVTIVFLLFVTLVGCAGQPAYLTTGQQTQAVSQKEQARPVGKHVSDLQAQYFADADRCRRLAVLSEQHSVGRGALAGVEFLEYNLGKGWDAYSECLERSGWTEERFKELIASE